MKDHYKRLGVSYKATQQEIRLAYRKLAVQYHPDKNNGDTASEAIFKEVNEAYQVLSHPATRSRYDTYFFYRPSPHPNYSRTYTPPPPRPGAYRRPTHKKKPKLGFEQYLSWVFIIFFVFNVLNAINRSSTSTPTYDKVIVEGDTSLPEIKNLLHSGNVTYSENTTANDTGPKLTRITESTADNWHDAEYSTGQGPSFYNFDARYDYSIHNSLTISGSNNCDAVVNVMDSSTHKCIRCIYIHRGDAYSVEGIPSGSYYSIIAFGNHYQQKNINGKLSGRFTNNATYKMGGSFAFKKPQARKHTLNLQDSIALLDNHVYRTYTINEADFNN